MSKRLGVIFWLCTLVVLSGCMSAQELRDDRIAENQATFNSYPSDIQAKVQQGHIDVGFTRDMVRLAWGPPDRVFSRTTKAKRSIVWSYTRIRSYPNMDRMSIPVYFIDSNGRRRITYRSVWVNWDTHEEYTVARVEFVKGRISAIEQLEGDGADSL